MSIKWSPDSLHYPSTAREYEKAIVKEASKVFHEEGRSALMKALVYHGFRSKKSPEELKKIGISYPYRTPLTAKTDIKEVLRQLGFRTDYPVITYSLEDPHRLYIYVTVYRLDICGWATRSPEAVLFPLEIAIEEENRKIPLDKRLKFLEDRYGKPMFATLNLKLSAVVLYMHPANICTKRIRIRPKEIIDIEYCTGEKSR